MTSSVIIETNMLHPVMFFRKLLVPVQFHFRRFRVNRTMPSALVLLSEGAEEMETVITVDVLRRGGVIE